MRFLSIYTPEANRPPPKADHMAAMGKFVEQAMKDGWLVATGGLLPVTKGGVQVRSTEGKMTVTDGPFIEAKEHIGGFALIEVKSKEEAIEKSKRFLELAGNGLSELRQIMGPDDMR